MQKNLSLSAVAAFAATLSLTACSKAAPSADPVDANGAAANEAAAVPPPPTLTKSAAYRCTGGKTFRADYYSDGSSVITLDGGKFVRLTSDAPGDKASYANTDGYALKTDGAKASYTAPGSKALDCES
jgi:hypothetical protein